MMTMIVTWMGFFMGFWFFLVGGCYLDRVALRCRAVWRR